MPTVSVYWSHSFIPELVRPDGLVFDLGVNDGGFSRLMAPRCREVIGFEPDPAWTHTLKLPANVTLVPKAVAARPGPMPFHVNAQLCSSMHYTDAGSTTIDVEAITLEQAMATRPEGRVDLMKIDIEGEEIDVLATVPLDLLARVAQLTVEFHDFLDRSRVPDIEAVIARLEQFGFVAICFSFRSFGDTLFINRALVPLTAWQRFWLVARYKYLRGLGRAAGRLVRA